MRLKIQLPPTWYQDKDNDSPATFYRENSSNALQVSWAENNAGSILPGTSGTDLVAFALNFGAQNGFGEALESRDGTCRFGKYGTALFRSTEHPRIQIWVLSNERDFIFVTHICDQAPTADEISEAQQIAENLTLGPEIERLSLIRRALNRLTSFRI